MNKEVMKVAIVAIVLVMSCVAVHADTHAIDTAVAAVAAEDAAATPSLIQGIMASLADFVVAILSLVLLSVLPAIRKWIVEKIGVTVPASIEALIDEKAAEAVRAAQMWARNHSKNYKGSDQRVRAIDYLSEWAMSNGFHERIASRIGEIIDAKYLQLKSEGALPKNPK